MITTILSYIFYLFNFGSHVFHKARTIIDFLAQNLVIITIMIYVERKFWFRTWNYLPRDFRSSHIFYFWRCDEYDCKENVKSRGFLQRVFVVGESGLEILLERDPRAWYLFYREIDCLVESFLFRFYFIKWNCVCVCAHRYFYNTYLQYSLSNFSLLSHIFYIMYIFIWEMTITAHVSWIDFCSCY